MYVSISEVLLISFLTEFDTNMNTFIRKELAIRFWKGNEVTAAAILRKGETFQVFPKGRFSVRNIQEKIKNIKK